jgi:succinate dehydrogenase/fumarate reductase-like Fe-S protein
MSYRLDIKAFFFNAKTDYLPYYKQFRVKIDKSATAKDLLKAIEQQNENFSFPKQKLVFRINGWVVDAKQPLSAVVERLGTELTIDPVYEYRSTNGLRINDNDFMQSFELLSAYASEEDLKYYKSLYALHYASETLQYERDYIGDAILLLAHKMISEGNPHKQEILQAISYPEAGLFACEYDNNLFNAQDHTRTIESLKAMAKEDPMEDSLPDARSLVERIKTGLGIDKRSSDTNSRKTKHYDDIVIENIEEKLAAYYPGAQRENEAEIHALIEEKCAGLIRFDKAHKRCGLTILEDQPQLAFRKAGAILLDAYDSMAEVLVIEDPKAYEMISQNFKKIEAAIGREIGLELTTAAALTRQFNAAAAA